MSHTTRPERLAQYREVDLFILPVGEGTLWCRYLGDWSRRENSLCFEQELLGGKAHLLQPENADV